MSSESEVQILNFRTSERELSTDRHPERSPCTPSDVTNLAAELNLKSFQSATFMVARCVPRLKFRLEVLVQNSWSTLYTVKRLKCGSHASDSALVRHSLDFKILEDDAQVFGSKKRKNGRC